MTLWTKLHWHIALETPVCFPLSPLFLIVLLLSIFIACLVYLFFILFFLLCIGFHFPNLNLFFGWLQVMRKSLYEGRLKNEKKNLLCKTLLLCLEKTLNAVHLYSLYVQPDIAPIEEWFVRFTMHHRLNMFTTEGTLLDVFREPLLQWHLGKPINSTEIDALIPDVINITVSKCPCANDVAVIALICNDTVYGKLCICEFEYIHHKSVDQYCAGLSLVNIILTNNRLIILTTLGLFISQDLRYPTGRILNVCEFDDYFSANVWYNVQCLANVSTCFYSNDPYTEWYSCLPHRFHGGKTLSRRVVAFLIDYQQNTGIGLITVQITKDEYRQITQECRDHKLNRQTKFPVFWFPDPKFLPFGMFFHPGSHFLYVYGSQVCISGNIYGSEV
uniref:Uncharacterized protein n=1 Tax=Gopherus evgoodei TaxID=1825980 RepID=A0A8C4VTP3_9SAUR